MLHFEYNQEQQNALEGLAYRIADNAYMIERYGREEATTELQQNHNTIIGLFEKLDSLNVPYWVQNSVIGWAENWRTYKEQYFVEAMKRKNIYPSRTTTPDTGDVEDEESIYVNRAVRLSYMLSIFL